MLASLAPPDPNTAAPARPAHPPSSSQLATAVPPHPEPRTRGRRRAGAYLTTTESVLMELIRDKNHPSFKAISNNLKETKLAESLGFI